MDRFARFVFNIKRRLGLIRSGFAGQDRLNVNYSDMKEFAEEILGYDIEGMYISLESSLRDFSNVPGRDTKLKDFVAKIKARYYCDISPVKNRYIVDIVRYMKYKGVRFSKYNIAGKKASRFS